MPLDSDDSERGWENPSNNLWVGNLAPDVTHSDLMDLFAPYGAIDSVTHNSARSYAFVFFKRVYDAKAARTAFQGASIRGNHIRIEFARPAKPCKHLWVGGISPAVAKDELEAEFSKFGQIEDFKFFRDRNVACVEFLNLDDATQAMKTMNGKCIGGDQIRVDFLRSQSTKKDSFVDYGRFQSRPEHSQPSMGRNGQLSNTLRIGFPPSFQIDEQMLHNALILFGEIERIKSFPSRHYAIVEFRSIDEARRAKEGLQGRLFNDPRITIMYSSSELGPGKDYPGFYAGRPDLLHSEHPFRPLQMDIFGHNHPSAPNNFPGQLPPGAIMGSNVPMQSHSTGPEFSEMGTLHKYQDASSKSKMGPNLKRQSPPAPGMLPSPLLGIRPPTRSASGAWDVLDINQFQRDSKRSRIDDSLLTDDSQFPLRNHGVPGSVQPDIEHIWRGLIAKGGTPVCRARCVPIGKGIGTELPDVVDCAARTGLDMLTKHYADAIGFGIVFFLPDSEDDFASYTEFLLYLKAKNRAGVAKFVDNTTLFLVPPSDFLTDVLKVMGPERLYGVVLKFPPVSSSTSMQQLTHLSEPSAQYMPQLPPSQAEYGLISAKEEPGLPVGYKRLLHEDSKLLPKPHQPATSGPPSVHSVPPDYAPTNTAGRVKLTPDLIATLASLLPATTQASASDDAATAVGSSTMKPPFSPVAPIDGSQSHLWKRDHQYQPYPPASTPGHPAQAIHGSSHSQDAAASLHPQGAVSSRPMTNFTIPSQSGRLAVSPQVSHQYQVEVSPSPQIGYGVVQGTDASVLYSPQPFQQPNNFITSSSQVSNSHPPQLQTVMPFSTDKVNSEPLNLQLQSAPYGTGQGSSEVEADKNQRYQSTLQFAANLLHQIQQQQTQGGNGPGNQQ